jgi:hypothetical protein
MSTNTSLSLRETADTTRRVSAPPALRSSLSVVGGGYVKDRGFDPIDFFHRGSTNFRGYDPSQPEGLASTHVPIPGKLRFDPYGNPLDVPFHVDQRYPYEDLVGFGEHAGDVIMTILDQ